MRQDQFLFALAALAVLALVGGVAFTPQTIFATPQLATFDTGKSAFVASWTLRNNDVTYLPIKATKYVSDGASLVPNEQTATIKFVPSVPKCSIPLSLATSIPTITYKSFDGSQRVIEGISLYKGGMASASFQFTTSVSYKGVEQKPVVMDAVSAAKVRFTDADGNGYIEVEGQGFLGGANACASSAGAGLAKFASGGTTVTGFDTSAGKIQDIYGACGASLQFVPKVGDLVTFGQAQTCQLALDGLLSGTFLSSVTGFDRQAYVTTTPSLSFMEYSLSNLGTGVVSVKADASYFDANWVFEDVKPAKFSATVSPATFSTTSNNVVQFTVNVKNTDSIGGTFYGTASANGGTVTPASFGGNVVTSAGQSLTQTVLFYPPTVSSLSGASFSVTVCSRGATGTSDACQVIPVIGTVSPPIIPSPTPTVPPDFCEPNYHLENGKCVPNGGSGDFWAWFASILEPFRLTRIFGGFAGGFLGTFLLTLALTALLAIASLFALGANANSQLYPIVLPLFIVLLVSYWVLFQIVDLYWPVFIALALTYRYGKKHKWF